MDIEASTNMSKLTRINSSARLIVKEMRLFSHEKYG